MVQDATFAPLLSEREAARLLSLGVQTLRKWRWAGQGPRFRKLGAAVRYSEADLHEFVEAARRSSTSDTGQAGAL